MKNKHPDAALLAQFEAARAAVAGHANDLDELVAAEDRLAIELARRPCTTSDELVAKMAYLLQWEAAMLCRQPTMRNDFGAVLVALNEHLKQRGGVASAVGRQ